jgi:hypothetical protein
MKMAERPVTRSPLGFFALVFALSTPIWLIEPGDGPLTAAVGVPTIAALLLARSEEGLAARPCHGTATGGTSRSPG